MCTDNSKMFKAKFLLLYVNILLVIPLSIVLFITYHSSAIFFVFLSEFRFEHLIAFLSHYEKNTRQYQRTMVNRIFETRRSCCEAGKTITLLSVKNSLVKKKV